MTGSDRSRQRKQIHPADTLPLRVTATERKLLLEDVAALNWDVATILRVTPPKETVRMTLRELNELAGNVALEADHCEDGKKKKQLDGILQKVQALLDTHTLMEASRISKSQDAWQEKMVCDEAAHIAKFAAECLVTAEQLKFKTKPLEHFWLAPGQRDVLALLPGLPKALQNKLAKNQSSLTVAEVARLAMAIAEELPDSAPERRLALLLLARHLLDRLQEGITEIGQQLLRAKASKRKPKSKSGVLYQFKITLLGSQPPIWRRIQTEDCTLDKLHEHIQTAMGWTNSHLHQFEIDGERYGDPELLGDEFDEFEGIDSTRTMLSEVLPESGEPLSFKYEYDFGDGWEHEILFEGCPPPEKGKKYPLCLEGERACPPEDVGGVWGYADYLEAIMDPNHEQHDEMLEWSGPFDPEGFDPKKATREMREGLPDWRTM